ncbi:hypothetical protein [uncultured Nostoc sp.]|uniref:hypothetical protein n=1 Tax=uncultured Nostoc sp. TaxID=340711 RepID=UPI0035CB2C4F
MTDSPKSLSDLIVETTTLIREMNEHPEYKDLIAEKEESFAPAADAYGAMTEISRALHQKETQK